MGGPAPLGSALRKVERVIRSSQGNFEHIDGELDEFASAINLLVDALEDIKDFINSGSLESVAEHTHGGGAGVDT